MVGRRCVVAVLALALFVAYAWAQEEIGFDAYLDRLYYTTEPATPCQP